MVPSARRAPPFAADQKQAATSAITGREGADSERTCAAEPKPSKSAWGWWPEPTTGPITADPRAAIANERELDC